MKNLIEKITKLSESRIQEFIDTKNSWYKWHETYLEWIDNEFKEMKNEIKIDNSVYLEDELWDIFWDYMCLLSSLKQEWLISSEKKVFERCWKKFSERIWAVRKSVPWQDWIWKKIKAGQKIELKNEQEKILLEKKEQ